MTDAALLLSLLIVAGGDAEATSRRAKALYAEGHYSAAAALFDALWDEHGDPRYIYNAAFAHEAAAEDVAALADFTHFLGCDGLTEADRLDVRVHVGALKERLTPVPVEVLPLALASRAILVLEGSAGHASFSLEVATLDRDADAGHILFLTPGDWSLHLKLPPEQARHYRTEDITISVAASRPAPDRLQLRATPVISEWTLRLGPEDALHPGIALLLEDDLDLESPRSLMLSGLTTSLALRTGPWRATLTPRRRNAEVVHRSFVVGGTGGEMSILDLEPRRRLPRWLQPRDEEDRLRRIFIGASFGAAGVALVGSGATALGLATTRRANGVVAWNDDLSGGFDPAARRTVTLSKVGGGLVGAAIGAEIVALSGLAGARPRVWLAEMATGGVLSIGGAVWHGVAVSAQSSESGVYPAGSAPRTSVDDFTGSLSGSALVLGAGLGLLIGASTAYLMTRLTMRARPTREAVLRWR